MSKVCVSRETVRALGRWLREVRENRRLNQYDAACRSGLHFSQISRLELGKVSKPAFEDLVILGRAYGVSPNEIAERLGLWKAEEAAPLSAAQRERLVEALTRAIHETVVAV